MARPIAANSCCYVVFVRAVSPDFVLSLDSRPKILMFTLSFFLFYEEMRSGFRSGVSKPNVCTCAKTADVSRCIHGVATARSESSRTAFAGCTARGTLCNRPHRGGALVCGGTLPAQRQRPPCCPNPWFARSEPRRHRLAAFLCVRTLAPAAPCGACGVCPRSSV